MSRSKPEYARIRTRYFLWSLLFISFGREGASAVCGHRARSAHVMCPRGRTVRVRVRVRVFKKKKKSPCKPRPVKDNTRDCFSFLSRGSKRGRSENIVVVKASLEVAFVCLVVKKKHIRRRKQNSEPGRSRLIEYPQRVLRGRTFSSCNVR